VATDANADSLPPGLRPGQRVVEYRSDRLFFDLNKYELKPEALDALEGLVRDARAQNRQGLVLVAGYTDDLGSDAYNLRLSKKRAATVAAVLKKGLDGTRMRVVPHGYGKAKRDRATTEAERQANRRVVITFPPATRPTA
jgi:outer membrane protein OmpA-like peptidoglycan-associated protein